MLHRKEHLSTDTYPVITLSFRGSSLLQLQFNTLNAELNPICHLLALFGPHHILYFSRIRVKNT